MSNLFKGWQGDQKLHRMKLPENWIQHCVELPESGMGYQAVALRMVGNKSVNGIVLNASILETVDPIDPDNILEISLR